MIFFEGGKKYGFEFKYSDAPKLTKSMKVALEDLELERIFVLHPGKASYLLERRISVIGLEDYLIQPEAF